MGAVLVQQLVAVELAVLLVAWPLATNKSLVVPGALAAALLLAGTLVRYRGRRLAVWPGILLGFRNRRNARATAQLPQGTPQNGSDPDLSPVHECLPDLAFGTATDRTRRPVGMAGDGTFLTAVMLVEAPDEPLRPRRARRPLPLAAVAQALRIDDVALASAQIVQHSQPAPAPHLPPEALASRSYTELRDRESLDVPAVRRTWIALRLVPEHCATAVAARGGGLEGAQRTLLRAVNQLRATLGQSGLDCRILDEPALVQAMFTACGANPTVRRSGRSGPRTVETRHAWRCDDRWHTTYWISRWPRLSRGSTPDLVGALTGTPGLATTFSLTAEQGGGGSVGLTGHLRVSARSSDELDRAAQRLEARARALRVGLTRLDWEQQPGLVATLPLGGHT
ncbi:type VII secretion protein EccE [Yinghuangia sp. YIM S09857]|uniref:type VII secretion protein EccE n=1 Tax=Yinghuangia sp. YIM S09857 TaxID=3436929 RepID=UPI003F53DFB2